MRTTVLDGGVTLSVFAQASQTPLASSNYWSWQEFGRTPMEAAFKLPKPMLVRFVLSSWSPFDQLSTWLLTRATVVRKARSSA